MMRSSLCTQQLRPFVALASTVVTPLRFLMKEGSMLFNSGIGQIFNCGFCHTAIYECQVKKAKSPNEKETEESSATQVSKCRNPSI